MNSFNLSKLMQEEKGAKGERKWLIKNIIAIGIVAASYFGGLGGINIWGIFYLLSIISMLVLQIFYLPGELRAARSGAPAQFEKWDLLCAHSMIWSGPLREILAGIDVRFGISDQSVFSPSVRILGLFVFVVGNLFLTWAMKSNKFFIPVVTVGKEQTVQTNGPYQFVRHPGYFGVAFGALGVPFLLGSWVCFVGNFTLWIAIIIRIHREDALLHSKLDGYKEYASKTKYKLIPFIW